ncbi:MAG: Ig-like domain-containing protein, partial [Clostridia bacterium]|nr:Ig-like domain-containing protein [Clostridia bacterium]
IGYCSANGLISGDFKQFNPVAFITDRDFLKLLLAAMDYREGVDYTTEVSSVFDKAKELGLINLSYYIQHMNKEIYTTRSSAVELFYTALKLKCKTGITLSQKLINEGVVTRKQVAALGLAEDTVLSDITKINNLDLNRLEIKFNENITDISALKVYAKDNANDVFESRMESLMGDTLVITTAGLNPAKDYTLELTGVQDEKDNVIEKVSKNFKGFDTKEVNSNFFKIKKIEAVSARTLKVYFTQPVNLNSEVCLYYSIIKDNMVIADGKQGAVKAGLLTTENNAVLLTLNSDLVGDTLYTLTIDGNMMSAYGTRMNNGLGDSMRFLSVGNEALKFEMRQIVAMDKKTLFVVFSKEVNPFLAQQIFNFYVTDEAGNPIRISSTAVDHLGTGVYISLGQDIEKSKKYYLTINNLNDITKQEFISEERYAFQADFSSLEAFNVNGINVIDMQTVEFSFNRPLDPVAALRLSSYTICRWGGYNSMNPEKILYNPNKEPNKVKLFFSKNTSINWQYDYELRIDSNMKDYLGNTVSISGVRFSGSSTQQADNKIDSVVPVSNDSVKVTFSKEIAYNASNLALNNFALEYSYNRNSVRKIPASVVFVDEKTVILRFDILEFNTSYKVKIANLQDFSGNTLKNAEKTFEQKAE